MRDEKLKQAESLLERQLMLGRELIATRRKAAYNAWEIFTAEVLDSVFPDAPFAQSFRAIDQINMTTRLIYQTNMLESALDSIRLFMAFDPESPSLNMESLAKAVAATHNNDELRTLAAGLGLEYEDLPGNTNSAKSLSLVQAAQRHNIIQKLLTALRQARPNRDWNL